MDSRRESLYKKSISMRRRIWMGDEEHIEKKVRMWMKRIRDEEHFNEKMWMIIYYLFIQLCWEPD